MKLNAELVGPSKWLNACKSIRYQFCHPVAAIRSLQTPVQWGPGASPTTSMYNKRGAQFSPALEPLRAAEIKLYLLRWLPYNRYNNHSELNVRNLNKDSISSVFSFGCVRNKWMECTVHLLIWDDLHQHLSRLQRRIQGVPIGLPPLNHQVNCLKMLAIGSCAKGSAQKEVRKSLVNKVR